MAPRSSKRIRSSGVRSFNLSSGPALTRRIGTAVDFETIHLQRPPFVPNLRHPTDTQYFDDNIDPTRMAPPNGPLPDTPADPLLRDKKQGKQLLELRKQLAFAGYTFKGPRREVFDPRVGIVGGRDAKGHFAMFEVEDRESRGRSSEREQDGSCKSKMRSLSL